MLWLPWFDQPGSSVLTQELLSVCSYRYQRHTCTSQTASSLIHEYLGLETQHNTSFSKKTSCLRQYSMLYRHYGGITSAVNPSVREWICHPGWYREAQREETRHSGNHSIRPQLGSGKQDTFAVPNMFVY